MKNQPQYEWPFQDLLFDILKQLTTKRSSPKTLSANGVPRGGIYQHILIFLRRTPPDQLDNMSVFTSPETSVNLNLLPWVLYIIFS